MMTRSAPAKRSLMVCLCASIFRLRRMLLAIMVIGHTPLPASADLEVQLAPRQGRGVVEVLDQLNLKSLTVITRDQFGTDIRLRYFQKRKKIQYWLHFGFDRMIFVPPANYGIINLDQSLFGLALSMDYSLGSRVSVSLNLAGTQVPVFQYANNQASQVLTEMWPSANVGALLRVIQLGPFSFKVQGSIGYFIAGQAEYQGHLNYRYDALVLLKRRFHYS